MRHSRRGDDAQQLHVRADAAKAGGQCASSISPEIRVSLPMIKRGVLRLARQHSRRRAADLHRELRSQVFSGNAARAVGSEQLSHCVILLVNVPS
mgnify:CR=1 FL=1